MPEPASLTADPIVNAAILVVLALAMGYAMLYFWHTARSRRESKYRGSPAENAAKELGERIFGFATGIVATLAILAGYAVEIGAYTMGTVAEIPAILVAALGLGHVAGVYSLTPGLFIIGALAAFLLAVAVRGSRRR